jgi:hypothetical protein
VCLKTIILNSENGLSEDPVTTGGKSNARGTQDKIWSTSQHFWNFDGAQWIKETRDTTCERILYLNIIFLLFFIEVMHPPVFFMELIQPHTFFIEVMHPPAFFMEATQTPAFFMEVIQPHA